VTAPGKARKIGSDPAAPRLRVAGLVAVRQLWIAGKTSAFSFEPTGRGDPMSKFPQTSAIEEHRFTDDGHVPNNPRLPLVVYRGVLDTGADAARSCAALFARHGWTGAWRNGIYAYHHYHSTAHEVLGIVAGSARVRLGGESGRTVVLAAGDVVVIPAGVAHKCEAASPDLLVVGAYPRGQSPDSRQAGVQERERALGRIAAVPLPEADPVHGGKGPLIDRWRLARAEW
jgi:uncharacterized protein YjlB